MVLTVPLTAETRHLIGRAELARMKPTGILVNIARGPVVDTDALTEALTKKTIYAAALDVTDPEPLPRDHPLLRLDNVIIAPHLGSATEQTRLRMAQMSIDNLQAGLREKAAAVPGKQVSYFAGAGPSTDGRRIGVAGDWLPVQPSETGTT